jgi:hypothetical protein
MPAQSCSSGSDCPGFPTYTCAHPYGVGGCNEPGHCYPDCRSPQGSGVACAEPTGVCSVLRPGPSPPPRAPTCAVDSECAQYGNQYLCAYPDQACDAGQGRCYAECSTTATGQPCSEVNHSGQCASFHPHGQGTPIHPPPTPTECPTTDTIDHPLCATGVAQNWNLMAKCSGPACSTSAPVHLDTATGPLVDNCRLTVDAAGDVTSLTGAGCPPTTNFNCQCLNPASPMRVTLTNTTPGPVKVRQVQAGSTAKLSTLCALGPTETCTVGRDFIVTSADAAGDPYDAFYGGPGWATSQASYNVAADPTHPDYLDYSPTAQ